MAAQLALYGGVAALELAGGYFASQNIKATAKLNQEIADQNAEFAELDAYDALAEGQTQQARYQGVIDDVLAEQQLIQAAQDVDTSYGTASAKKEEAKFTGMMNLMEIEKASQEKALGYISQANDFRNTGALQRADANMKAATTMFNSVAGAAKTGLTGYERGK